MSLSKTIGGMLMALTVAGPIFASSAQADPMVTYYWTTTSEGYGAHVSAPSSASFEVPLSDVLSGVISENEISNIQLSYPGLTFNSEVTSSGGLDSLAFVDPTTGKFIYHDANQGLDVIAFAGTNINNANTLLSITVDNAYGPYGNPLTSVADQFNALNGGNSYAGFPTAGYWTADFPTISPSVPEPSTWALMLFGVGMIGAGLRVNRRKNTAALAVA